MTGDGTTIVLGWDGLDYELLSDFSLLDAFGDHHAEMETFDNPVIGEPHTRELWPSMITGVMPDEHGIWAVTEDDGVKWSNPTIRMASRFAQYTIPDSVRTVLGRMLRSRGAEVEKFDEAYYADRELATVFDGRRSLPIAIPNYRTELDDRLDVMFDRGAELYRFLDRTKGDWKPASPETQVAIEQEMAAEVGQKLALIENALDRDYDIVFAWFGWIDTAGHVDPVVGNDYQRRAYDQAAEWTRQIQAQLEPEDTLICVSDHGLRDGEHTHKATIASSELAVVNQTEHVTDLPSAIDLVTARSGDDGAIASESEPVDNDNAAEVHDRLADLGYI